jgi:omega-6 fatty acid desaturase (delta-12 desaturase)
MTEDQVFVPRTRSERGLPEFNPDEENLAGSKVSAKVMEELKDALGDSPIGAMLMGFQYLVRAYTAVPFSASLFPSHSSSAGRLT